MRLPISHLWNEDCQLLARKRFQWALRKAEATDFTGFLTVRRQHGCLGSGEDAPHDDGYNPNCTLKWV